MTEAPEAPQGGALSVDEAVALLDRRDDDQMVGAEPAWPDDVDLQGDARAPEEADDQAERLDDGEDEAEAEEEGDVDRPSAPKYWSKEAKARFAELDPELQAVVLSQEGPREEAAARAKAAAEETRRQAVDHAAQAHGIAQALAEALPEAYEQFQARWEGVPDWAAIAEAYGPEAANQARAQFMADQGRLAQAEAAAQAANDAEQQAFVAREVVALQQLDPELVDPARGDELRGEIVRYLNDKGVPASELTRISALEIHLARKAMLWDRAQDRARAATPKPRPSPPATRPLTRGGASSGPVDPKARRAAQAASRFAKSRSLEDAVALLNAQGD
jgi:hypothetical protein